MATTTSRSAGPRCWLHAHTHTHPNGKASECFFHFSFCFYRTFLQPPRARPSHACHARNGNLEASNVCPQVHFNFGPGCLSLAPQPASTHQIRKHRPWLKRLCVHCPFAHSVMQRGHGHVHVNAPKCFCSFTHFFFSTHGPPRRNRAAQHDDGAWACMPRARAEQGALSHRRGCQMPLETNAFCFMTAWWAGRGGGRCLQHGRLRRQARRGGYNMQ